MDLLYGVCVADIDLIWGDSYNRAYFNIREKVSFFLITLTASNTYRIFHEAGERT